MAEQLGERGEREGQRQAPGRPLFLGHGQTQRGDTGALGERRKLGKAAVAAQRAHRLRIDAKRRGETIADQRLDALDHQVRGHRECVGQAGRGLARAAECPVDERQSRAGVERQQDRGRGGSEAEQRVGGEFGVEFREIVVAFLGGLRAFHFGHRAEQRIERERHQPRKPRTGAIERGDQLGRARPGTQQLGAMLRDRPFGDEGAFGLHWTRNVRK